MEKPRYFLQCSGSNFWPDLCEHLSVKFDLSFLVTDDRLLSEFSPAACPIIIRANDLKFGLFDRSKCAPFPSAFKDNKHYRRREKEALYSLQRATVGGDIDLPDRLHLISVLTDFYWYYFSKIKPTFGIATEAPHTWADLLLHGVAESCSIPILHFQQNSHAPTITPVLGPDYQKIELGKLLEPRVDAERRRRLSIYRDNFDKFVERAREPVFAQHEVDFHERDRTTFSGVKSLWRRFYVPYSWLLEEWNQRESYSEHTDEPRGQCPTPTHSFKGIQHRIQLGPRATLYAYRQSKILKDLQRSLASNATSILPERCATFFLQFEPEKTSVPDGGLYSDQLAAVRAVADALHGRLPLVACEHPTQFSLLSRGFRVRRPRFYEELANIPNVVVAPMGHSRADLMQRTSIAITLQGSIGLEAIARGLPVIALGHPWYSPLDGIFGPTDDRSLGDTLKEALDCHVDSEGLSNRVWQRVDEDQIVALLNPSFSREFPNVESDTSTITALAESLFLG